MSSMINYQGLTEEAFERATKQLEASDDRHFVAWTTLEGAEQFDKALRQEVIRGQLKYLQNKELITKEEADTLKKMMDASDKDFTVAELIIKNYESNI